MNRLLLLFVVIVAIALLITFAPFFIVAAIVFLIFKKKQPVQPVHMQKKSDHIQIESEIIDVQWKDVTNESI